MKILHEFLWNIMILEIFEGWVIDIEQMFAFSWAIIKNILDKISSDHVRIIFRYADTHLICWIIRNSRIFENRNLCVLDSQFVADSVLIETLRSRIRRLIWWIVALSSFTEFDSEMQFNLVLRGTFILCCIRYHVVSHRYLF